MSIITIDLLQLVSIQTAVILMTIIITDLTGFFNRPKILRGNLKAEKLNINLDAKAIVDLLHEEQERRAKKEFELLDESLTAIAKTIGASGTKNMIDNNTRKVTITKNPKRSTFSHIGKISNIRKQRTGDLVADFKPRRKQKPRTAAQRKAARDRMRIYRARAKEAKNSAK